MDRIYDATKDEQFSKGYIDIDEMRTRKLDDGRQIPFRYMHGGFEGTPVKFSFCFPEAEEYEKRFYQYLSPFPGPEEELASLSVTGIDDKIAFCITHRAYYVESNMGSGAVFTNSEDNTMSYRSSAAAAEYSRVMARKVYGYEHRPFGYVYGGSGDPYAGLNEEEAEALREATLFGYPLKNWFASADLNDGALPVLAPGVKGMDPEYFEDFWKVPGYLGADPESSAARERICMDTKIKLQYVPGKKAQMLEGKDTEKVIDSRNGVNDAWKKMISSSGMDTEPWLELAQMPVPSEGYDLYLKGLVLTVKSGKAEGKKVQVGKIADNRIYLTDGFGMDNITETLELIEAGDEVHLDNSDYIAIQTYHRHQVPGRDYHAWDQFRNSDGEPLYPQQKVLVGPVFCGNGPGCKQNGLVQGKVMICAALMDEQAYPWQADWYRRKIASVHDGNEKDYCRLYYFDNVLHDDITASVDELHATSYIAGLKQVLIDLALWVEEGVEPLPSSRYQVDVGHVQVADFAAERGGLQPVVELKANGSKCAHVKAGEPVKFTAQAEVPDQAGSLTFVEWSFEGETDFPRKGEWLLRDKGQRGKAEEIHVYGKPGTYFAVVRVKSERNGDKTAPFTQIRNIDRVRVVVEP